MRIGIGCGLSFDKADADARPEAPTWRLTGAREVALARSGRREDVGWVGMLFGGAKRSGQACD